MIDLHSSQEDLLPLEIKQVRAFLRDISSNWQLQKRIETLMKNEKL